MAFEFCVNETLLKSGRTFSPTDLNFTVLSIVSKRENIIYIILQFELQVSKLRLLSNRTQERIF